MLQRFGALAPVREVKFARLDLKRVDADGTFSGYASLFGKEDMGHDVVMPGAFAESLKSRHASAIKLLFQHDPNEPIGVWLEIREDAKGLWVKGRLMQDVARAREILSLMRAGALDGLSIGFRTVTGRTDPKTGVRSLHKIDLWEISIVTFPMLAEARVDAVKRRTSREGMISNRDELMRKLAVEIGRLRAHARVHSSPGPKPVAKAHRAAGEASPHARLLGSIRRAAAQLKN
jgi:HK97 family phage prohead protease